MLRVWLESGCNRATSKCRGVGAGIGAGREEIEVAVLGKPKANAGAGVFNGQRSGYS